MFQLPIEREKCGKQIGLQIKKPQSFYQVESLLM